MVLNTQVPYWCPLWCRAWAKPLKERPNEKRKDMLTVWSTMQRVLWRNVRNEALPIYWVCEHQKRNVRTDS